jgi:hypothetical protein
MARRPQCRMVRARGRQIPYARGFRPPSARAVRAALGQEGPGAERGEGEAWPALPPPRHHNDWLAQHREEGEAALLTGD